jgi:hypothetical protein
MISVLTLTYKRHHLLEEAIQSFLLQNVDVECELVILNDAPDTCYTISDSRIRIINNKKRFSSIGKKLEYGMKQCKYDYVYRLDDDDLLSPWGLSIAINNILQQEEYDIYRCKAHYFFQDNEYKGIGGSVNNGNVYFKKYINRIDFPDISNGEDSEITFGNNSKIYTGDGNLYSMIYRWGMPTTHVSGIGSNNTLHIYSIVDNFSNESGNIELTPHFNNDYYGELIKNIQ